MTTAMDDTYSLGIRAAAFRHHPYSWTTSRISVAVATTSVCDARHCAPCSVDDDDARAFVFDRSHSLHSCGLSVDGCGADSAPSTPPAGSLSPLSLALSTADVCTPHHPALGDPHACSNPMRREDSLRPLAAHAPTYLSASAVPKRRHSSGASSTDPILSGTKPAAAVVKYALVQFKFHSEYFVAPFRVGPGDAVVTSEGEGCCICRIGLVRHVAAGPSEMRSEFPVMPPASKTLVRHAREYDRQCKNRVIAAEAADLVAVAKHVASGGASGAADRFTVRDLEWCQDCRNAAVFVSCAKVTAPKDFVLLSSAIREVLQSLRGTHDVSIRLVECPTCVHSF